MLWLNILLMIVGLGLTAAILMQARSAGLGGAFGGGSEGFHVRRGGEKKLFQLTVVLAAAFLALAAAHLLVS